MKTLAERINANRIETAKLTAKDSLAAFRFELAKLTAEHTMTFEARADKAATDEEAAIYEELVSQIREAAAAAHAKLGR
jgi:hypothetical protein